MPPVCLRQYFVILMNRALVLLNPPDRLLAVSPTDGTVGRRTVFASRPFQFDTHGINKLRKEQKGKWEQRESESRSVIILRASLWVASAGAAQCQKRFFPSGTPRFLLKSPHRKPLNSNARRTKSCPIVPNRGVGGARSGDHRQIQKS